MCKKFRHCRAVPSPPALCFPGRSCRHQRKLEGLPRRVKAAFPLGNGACKGALIAGQRRASTSLLRAQSGFQATLGSSRTLAAPRSQAPVRSCTSCALRTRQWSESTLKFGSVGIFYTFAVRLPCVFLSTCSGCSRMCFPLATARPILETRASLTPAIAPAVLHIFRGGPLMTGLVRVLCRQSWVEGRGCTSPFLMCSL
jgi:hypothetical protein